MVGAVKNGGGFHIEVDVLVQCAPAPTSAVQYLVGAAFWDGQRAMSLGGGTCFSRRVLHSRGGGLPIPARNTGEVWSVVEMEEGKTNPNLREPKI
jgi:hypothetical protein